VGDGNTANRGVADFSYEIERGRRAEPASPSQFHSRIKQCPNRSVCNLLSMSKVELSRATVLLSLQRALLEEVSGDLRGVTCGWDQSKIVIRCLFNGEIIDDDRESMECVSTQVVADFPEQSIELEIIRLDMPQPLNFQMLMDWVYWRRE
jgi:hypothetical protein